VDNYQLVGSSVQNLVNEFQDSIAWQPVKAVGKDYQDVPPEIAAAASEVHSCLSIGAIRGAIAIARAVVEATAKSQGITKGNLQDKIDGLAKAGKIRPDTQDAAQRFDSTATRSLTATWRAPHQTRPRPRRSSR
jgi:hypothetical protein